MPLFRQPGEGSQTKTVIHVDFLAARAKVDSHLERVPSSAREQRHNDDRQAQVVGRTQRAGHNLSNAEVLVKQANGSSVFHAFALTLGRRPSCPGRPVNLIESEDEVQEFEPSQDAGMRQVLSVQVDVFVVRPSTRRCTAAGRAWDRAYPSNLC